MTRYQDDQHVAQALSRLSATPVPPDRAQAQRIARAVSQRAATRTDIAPRPAWRLTLATALSVAAMALIAGLLVALAGGARPPTLAWLTTPDTVATPARLGERRVALLDALSWHVARDIGPQSTVALAGGDRIIAYQAVTITFADGSTALLAANTSVIVLGTQRGIGLELGAATSRVARADGGAPYIVRSPVAEYVVKGTVFHLRTDGVTDFIGAEEGVVSVARAGGAAAQTEVRAGEQLTITAGAQPLIVELRPPLLSLQTPEGQSAPAGARVRQALIAARGYPGSALRLSDAAGGMTLAETTLDSSGNALIPLPLTADGPYTVLGRLHAPDGRTSEMAGIAFVLDTQPPDIEISQWWDNGAGQVSIRGATEPDAIVTINQLPVVVDAEGRFAVEMAATPGRLIQIAATDEAGNTRIVERRP